jgi:anaerobic ribonucleoside-triphosphate reductase activating protein
MDNTKVKILKTVKESFVDFPDNNILPSLVIFFVGCSHNCEGCQNQELQNPNLIADDVIEVDYISFVDFITKKTEQYNTKRIVFSGGDPLMLIDNRVFTLSFVDMFHKEYDICVYTGYDFDNVGALRTMKKCDYIVSGKFQKNNMNDILTPKTDEQFILASKNQKVFKLINDKYECISKNGIINFK